MRRTTLALLLVLGIVSAISGTVAALATTGKSACRVEPSDDDDTDPKPVLQHAVLKALRTLPVR